MILHFFACITVSILTSITICCHRQLRVRLQRLIQSAVKVKVQVLQDPETPQEQFWTWGSL